MPSWVGNARKDPKVMTFSRWMSSRIALRALLPRKNPALAIALILRPVSALTTAKHRIGHARHKRCSAFLAIQLMKYDFPWRMWMLKPVTF
jgi:hypothetical protein